jgi:hypothetical protein
MSDTILRTQDGKIVDNANPLAVKTSSSDIIQPVDLQSRLQTIIQSHNAVSLAAGALSDSATWIDCNGYDEIVVTFLNDAATSATTHILWSNDGTNLHGISRGTASSNKEHDPKLLPVGARYAKVRLANNDTVAHTMSAWTYLKV